MFPEENLNTELWTWKTTITFYLLYGGLFPLDLPCTLLFVRILYIYISLENDVEMVCPEKSAEQGELVGCSVKNIALLEDLAKINHVFCDKTGTLTKNELIFRQLSLGPNSYTDKLGQMGER